MGISKREYVISVKLIHCQWLNCGECYQFTIHYQWYYGVARESQHTITPTEGMVS